MEEDTSSCLFQNFIANLIPLSEFGDKRKCTATSSKYSNFTLARLCQNVGPALDSISVLTLFASISGKCRTM